MLCPRSRCCAWVLFLRGDCFLSPSLFFTQDGPILRTRRHPREYPCERDPKSSFVFFIPMLRLLSLTLAHFITSTTRTNTFLTFHTPCNLFLTLSLPLSKRSSNPLRLFLIPGKTSITHTCGVYLVFSLCTFMIWRTLSFRQIP